MTAIPSIGDRIEYERNDARHKFRGEVVDETDTAIVIETDGRKVHNLMIENIFSGKVTWKKVKP